MDKQAALGTHSSNSSLHLMHPRSACSHAAWRLMEEKDTNICTGVWRCSGSFPEEPMVTQSVMAVSPRHCVLCCVKHIPCTEDIQDAAAHMKRLVPRLTQWKPRRKPGPTLALQNPRYYLVLPDLSDHPFQLAMTSPVCLRNPPEQFSASC